MQVNSWSIAVDVLACNGIFQRPYALANASIGLVGGALYDALKDSLNENDRRALRGLIDDVNAQGLIMQLGLRIRQAKSR
jgi:hypothetical protein